MTVAKSLAEMEAEVEAYCRDKGWYDQEVPFFTAMALLHEEIAEAGRAWRDHGLKDMTGVPARPIEMGSPPEGPPKPEGVGRDRKSVV